MHQEEEETTTEAELRNVDEVEGNFEFKKVVKRWELYKKEKVNDGNWRRLYPDIRKDGGKLDIIVDLMKLDLKPLMKEINDYNKANKNCLGYLPLMVNSSKCQLGALNAQSFAERIISAANLILTKDRSSTDMHLLDMMVTIRMNRRFMEQVRESKYKDNVNMIRGFSETGKENDDDLW